MEINSSFICVDVFRPISMSQQSTDSIKRLKANLKQLKEMTAHNADDETLCQIIELDIGKEPEDHAVFYFECLLPELIEEGVAPEVLLYLNYNSRRYFRHVIKTITAKLDSEETASGKLDRLRYEQKILNQTPSDYEIAYSLKSPSLKEMIGTWITEEIRFLEGATGLTVVPHLQETEFSKKDFKIEFDMSVSQFAFFIKSFIEIGVIQNKNLSELIRFLARFVKTKRSENIAYESFRMKYYNVESSTKDAVKNTLHTAIGFINRN